MISLDGLTGAGHIRNCRGQLVTRLSPLSVGLCYPIMIYSHCLVQSFVLIGVPVN